ncbi:uncharacterized protein CIMG_13253 [Coccidioides immitis RS]|uniref:Uncharacterized protein n=1 Tax=Coccidioides immitis (strain RS) TaxID=246410 RepID=A0A0D8JUL2_COCIM|nr:uncharacterized protein CIMG_13253 [Coccidioides immitis RS]KJF60814.1 hypothetical protein CIMG_13253 [Coccidioides immitis RS]
MGRPEEGMQEARNGIRRRATSTESDKCGRRRRGKGKTQKREESGTWVVI